MSSFKTRPALSFLFIWQIEGDIFLSVSAAKIQVYALFLASAQKNC